MIDSYLGPQDKAQPRYDLSAEELQAREQELVRTVKKKFDDQDDLYAVWISPESPYADILRAQESFYWEHIQEIMAPHERQSLFLALVDTREGSDKIVHGFRISGGGVFTEDDRRVAQDIEIDPNSTGLVLIDDLINSEQGVTAEDFRGYYQARGFNVSKFISVETNFRRPGMEERVPRYNGLPASQVGYLALFQFCDREDLGVNESAIFASINHASVMSLGLVGLEYESIVGRDDLRTPVEDGKFDSDYKPVMIPASEKNISIFRTISKLAAPSLRL